ncbi:PadR family transcriptional regulator [Sporosarcina psychrophila]|uniref:PadR family transcriptional regulator n=1 Tax=Sporosarcina psychrophila TaxID=1476 RepID=UPI00078B340D|nr:PadR family transcriptional regulator [Sporosarcina psychrophila]AMQ06402.1 lineage-specific thermal regulator protein [Sporosarcina psychrophila]
MDDSLKGLKKSMDASTFSQLNFTEQHRKGIRDKISKSDDSEEDILLAVMQLLVYEKTGYELVNFLRGRGIRKFEDNEGSLYALLHKLEQDGSLQSGWNESTIKYYQLNNKGRKLLRKTEKQSTTKRFNRKGLVEG